MPQNWFEREINKYKGQKLLIGEDVTLERWLELMEKRPKGIYFEHYQFPTDEIKEQFLTNIFNYPDKTIIKILDSFLSLTGMLNSDMHVLDELDYLDKVDPEKSKRLQEEDPHVRKVLRHIASGGKTPVREGITWIIQLLPFSHREALDALEAYLHAHILHLPDGRINGLSDAMAILRARYFSTNDKVADSILNSLKPLDLEYLVESLYDAMGYETEMTKLTYDGGRDIIAKKDEPGKKEKIIIQCKKWQNVVGVEDVRALLGVVSHEKATKGVLITTSYFSSEAEKFANEESQIELIPFKQLQQLLSEHLGEMWIVRLDYLLSQSLRRHPLNKRK